MNSIKYIITFLLFLPIMAIAQFEGEIEMTTSSPLTKEAATLTWSIKNGKHALDINSQSTGMTIEYDLLVNDNKKEAWFLSDNNGSKQAYSVPYAQLEQRNDLNIPLNSAVKATEETEKIAGFTAVKYRIISGKSIVDCWLAEDTGLKASDFAAFMSGSDLLNIFKLNTIKGIPLKWEVKDVDGNVTLSQQMTKITSKSISDSTFEVPSDYTKNGTTK